ncbi:MAG: hypothetical protein ACRCZE_00030 [Candidatus Altimarinota bacterium]
MSQNDPQLKKLFKKAFPKQKPPARRNPKGSTQFHSKLDPDRYIVFREILLPNGEISAVFILFSVIILVTAFTIDWDYFVLFAALLILLMAFFRLGVHLYHYFIYRGSINRLPFPVLGWSNLVNRPSIEWGLAWHTVTIKIDLNTNDPQKLSAIRAALKIFFRKANKKFYTRDTSAPDAPSIDPRNDWEITSENLSPDLPHIISSGSSNPEVIGQIYRLMRGNLYMLQNKFPGLIQGVHLSITDQYQQIDIDIPTSAA